MNSDTKKTYDSAVDNLIVGIGNDYDRWSNPNGDGVDEQMKLIKEASAVKFKKTLYVKSGRKFDKIMHGSSVWASPAKHVRGSIFATEQNWFAWTGPNYL